MSGRLLLSPPRLPNPVFVIPAKAGIHHLTVKFTKVMSGKPPVRVMDSRLRGNDEVGDGNDEMSGHDEVRKFGTGR